MEISNKIITQNFGIFKNKVVHSKAKNATAFRGNGGKNTQDSGNLGKAKIALDSSDKKILSYEEKLEILEAKGFDKKAQAECLKYDDEDFRKIIHYNDIRMSLEEAQKLPEACEKYGKKLMIYQPHRARSETLCALDIIKSGKLGDIYMIKREFSYYFLRDHWQGYKKNGGGNLSNHGAHYIDQLLYLSGGNPAKAFSVLKPIITTGDADDCAKAVIVTDNNITLDLDINFVSAQNVNSMKIYGRYGEAELLVDADGRMTFRLKYYDPAEHDGDRRVFPFKEETIDVSEWAPISFYDKCHEYYALDAEPFVPITETLKVMAAIDMCRAASGEY